MSNHRKTEKIVSDFGHFPKARCNSAGSLFQCFFDPSVEVGMGGNFFSCVYPLPIAVAQKVEYWIL